MISFSHSKANLSALNTAPINPINSNTVDDNLRQLNNYESVEYGSGKHKLNNKYSQEKDTFDLYSYQDSNNIYVEDEDDQLRPLSKPKENVDYIKVTPMVTNNDNQIKYVVDLNDLRNHLNSTPSVLVTQTQTLNRLNVPHQEQPHYLNHDSLTLNPHMLRANASATTLSTQHHSQQHQPFYHDTQSLIPTLNRLNNNSIVVNQPVYQKSFDNLTMNSTSQQVSQASKDTQSTNQTINGSTYYYSSKSELNRGEVAQVNKVNNTNIELGSSLGMCRFFCGIIQFMFSCFNCFSSCCFKPCFSTMSICLGFGALIFVVVILGIGLLFTISYGILQLPSGIQNSICKCDMDPSRMYTSCHDNQTMFNMSNSEIYNNHTNLGNYYTSFNHNMNASYFSTNLTMVPTAATTTTTSSSVLAKKKQAHVQNTLKTQSKLKNRLARFVPLQYDVVFMPNLAEGFDFDLSKNSYGMEMRINMSIKIYCYNSTNILHLSTREFSTIELSFEAISDNAGLGVKKWSHNSATNILEIETSQDFKPNNLYKLNLFVFYKNYGANSVLDAEKHDRQFYYLSFNEKFENPFPVVVENTNKFTTFTGPSVFNISLIKPKSNQALIFNMDVQRVTKLANSSIEFINFKATPFVPVQTISFILGNFQACRRSDDINGDENSIKIRVCSTYQSNNLVSDSFDLIIDYVEKLMSFFQDYTKLEYPLKKLDIVTLPSESIIELANDDQTFAQLGIIYLPQFYVKNLKTNDLLEQEQVKLKIVHMISKQLAKHWFYKYQDCHNQMHFYKNVNENDFTVDTIYLVKSLCAEKKNLTFCSNKDLAEQDVSFKAFLQYNVNCYLFKGIVNWISYLSFKSINPDLFDLVFLEWSLIRELDEAYFFSNTNIKYIYQAYDFPRLTESNSLIKIKTEIKGLLSARTIYLLFGKDRFESFIKEWFKAIQTSTKQINDNLMISLNQTRGLNAQLLAGLNSNRNENSILDLVEKYASQYNIITLPRVAFKDVIRSWILAPNNIVLSLTRNYNKKDALINLDFSNNSIINDVYFPLNWLSGTLITSDDMKKVGITDASNDENFNVKWLNQSNVNIRDLPGADKWLIGNYMKMFGQLRINYDEQNWLMLVKQLCYHHKSLNANDRVQIIDDAFYLVNNQKMPISNALNILDYIPKEDNFLPWKYLVKNVKTIINYIEDDSKIYSKFRNYIIKLIEPTYKKLKWGESISDTIDEKLIRILVVDLLCSLDYEICKENSVKQLSDIIKIRVYNIPQHISKSVYCTAIRNTGITEWLFVWDYYLKQSDDSNMKDTLLYSLSCSSHIWILNLFLQKLVYENSIPVENLPIVFDYISQNPVGKYITWNHISQNYQLFYNKIGNDPELFFKILQVSTKELKFKYEIKQLYDFIDEIGSKNITFYYSKNNKEKLLTNIETRINRYSMWKNANANELNEWLSARKISEIPEYVQSK